MGFLERAIRKGVSQGVGRAMGEALSKAIEPHANELANKAAQRIDEAAAKNEEYENQRRQNSAFNGAPEAHRRQRRNDCFCRLV